MADKYTVTETGRLVRNDQPELWYVTYDRPDGSRHQHFFPPDTFAWRAAEYGLTDHTEILDVILHEALAPHPKPAAPQPFGSHATHAAPAAPDPPTLFQCASTREARNAHRQRITDIKTSIAAITPPGGGPNPLDTLLAAVTLDPDSVLQKTETVDIHRWETLYGALPTPAEETPRA